MPSIKLNPIKSEGTESETETEVEETTTDETVESNEDHKGSGETAETLARKKGWVPQEEFKGNRDEWIDAKEFNARGPLYDAIHQANRKIKRLSETLETFKAHYDKVEQRAKEQALTQLKVELKQASEERDIEKALEVKDKINDLTQEVKEAATTPEKTETTPEYDSWVAENPWYEQDRVMRTAATGLGYDLQKEHPEWSVKRIFDEVTKQIRESFPHKFDEDKVTTSVTTTARRTSTVTKSKSKLPSFKQLPDDAKVNYRKLVKSDRNPNGVLSHEEFMKDYLAGDGPINDEE